jgi:hypothetical protein
MIGNSPYANQVGTLIPVKEWKIPFDPVTSMFLKKFFQARARVQLGMIYGKINSLVRSFFHLMSLLETSQAKVPPIRIETTHAQALVYNEFLSGSISNDFRNSDKNSLFQ